MITDEAKRRGVLAHASVGSLAPKLSLSQTLYGCGLALLVAGMFCAICGSPHASEFFLAAMACGILSLRKDGAS